MESFLYIKKNLKCKEVYLFLSYKYGYFVFICVCGYVCKGL